MEKKSDRENDKWEIEDVNTELSSLPQYIDLCGFTSTPIRQVYRNKVKYPAKIMPCEQSVPAV